MKEKRDRAYNLRQEGKIKQNFKINIVLNHSERITVMVVLHETKVNVS